jgi:hypothetical protein
MPKKNRNDWNIADLVDLEYFLVQDETLDEAVLARRDRDFYRALAAQGAAPERRTLLRVWLERRREEARAKDPVLLPGDVTSAVFRLLPLLLLALGALIGSGLAWGVLSYSGTQPINLFAALILLVALPLCSSLLSVAWTWLRLLRRGSSAASVGGLLAGELPARLSHRLLGLAGEVSKKRQMSLARSWGVLRGRSGLYASVMGWQAFTLMQIAALGFSLAILLTVLLRGWIADLAFSWQTTAQVSAEQVHQLAVLLARPWSWLVDPPLAYPTLTQVAGSRVFLKEGLEHLSSADLQSWWYFLLWAILVYAVLPRLLLLGAAVVGVKGAWKRLSFSDARIEALLRRMQRARLHIDKENEFMGSASRAEELLPKDVREGMKQLYVLVPQELNHRFLAEKEIQNEFNAAVEVFEQVRLDEEEDAAVLHHLAQKTTPGAVLIVLEGWQPCITATLEYVKALRRTLGKQRLLVVGLIGREQQQGWQPTSEHEFHIWRQRLAALGDPALLVHNWKGSAHE